MGSPNAWASLGAVPNPAKAVAFFPNDLNNAADFLLIFAEGHSIAQPKKVWHFHFSVQRQKTVFREKKETNRRAHRRPAAERKFSGNTVGILCFFCNFFSTKPHGPLAAQSRRRAKNACALREFEGKKKFKGRLRYVHA
ncbi:hypothetical protein TW95_gp1294 [Pandoravirus inopinatum]|uniref:Uncharacterized protein n=1 Tax=Pandoravirus inopinatum TaxID=1605721 RepID=A0A0B5IYR3_9VIRU|nr:hypothetical protein TW95_gp1294 [Pandoravirus inopinatum]AJF98028.1 hypothetical protein [Pandoravirus inopinatum]